MPFHLLLQDMFRQEMTSLLQKYNESTNAMHEKYQNELRAMQVNFKQALDTAFIMSSNNG